MDPIETLPDTDLDTDIHAEVLAEVVSISDPADVQALATLLSNPMLVDAAVAVVSSWLLSLLTGATKRLGAWSKKRPSTPWKKRVRWLLTYEPAARDLIPWIAPFVLGAGHGAYAAWQGTGTVDGLVRGAASGLIAVGISQASRARAKATESARAVRSEAPPGE